MCLRALSDCVLSLFLFLNTFFIFTHVLIFFPCEIYSVVGEVFYLFFSYARLKVAAWCPSKCKEHQLDNRGNAPDHWRKSWV